MRTLTTLLRTRMIPFFLVLLMSSGCGLSPSASQKVADHFMESYYVKTDLSAALLESDGIAADKIRKSLVLTEGQDIDAETHRPKISFKKIQSQEEKSEAGYLYEVTIQPVSSSVPLKKTTSLKLRQKEGSLWKVTQFIDIDTETTPQ